MPCCHKSLHRHVRRGQDSSVSVLLRATSSCSTHADPSRYLFLLERVHIVRAPFVDRTRDRLYVIGAILTTGGFFAIMAWQFVNPFSELNHQTGICRIGIEPQAAMAVIVLDILINTVLTGIFVWQLRPALGSAAPKMRSLASNTTCVETDSPSHGFRQWMGKTRHSMRTSSRSDLRVMLVRNVVGSGFMLMVTVCNNSLFLSWAFAKMSHACLLMCLTDSKFAHFSTMDKANM